MASLVDVQNLCKTFEGAPEGRRAVDDVSFTIEAGETLGLVGESGCGKTTLGRMILRLIDADSGRVLFDGEDVLAASPRRMRELRRDMQIVFQDPFGSLDPRFRILDIATERLVCHEKHSRAELRAEAAELMRAVGLDESALARYPHEFSGGQRQRVGIARALAFKPTFSVPDEPVSALDV